MAGSTRARSDNYRNTKSTDTASFTYSCSTCMKENELDPPDFLPRRGLPS